MKVYPDTTVLLAAFFVDDFSAQWLRRLLASPHELIIGVPVARDFAQTAQTRFNLSPPRFANALKVLKRHRFAPATRTVPSTIPNPDDAPVLGCALAAGVDYFITGATGLLQAEQIEGLPILSPRDSWPLLFPDNH